MKKLKKAGFFKELDHGEETAPSIKDVLGGLSEEILGSVNLYLKKGVLLVASPSLVQDVLDFDSDVVIGSLGLLTDGVWVWPSDLAYYVEKYRVDLPSEFIFHMENNGWEIGSVDLKSIKL